MGISNCDGALLFDRQANSTLYFLEALDTFKRVYSPIHGYVCAVICGFGVATNLVHILVLTRAGMRSSAVNTILTVIAGCDLCLMLSYLAYLYNFVFGPERPCYNPYTSGWFNFLLWHIALSICLHTCSLWLAVLMAFVRRMTLKRAHPHSPWQRPALAWRLCAGVCAVVVALGAPTLFIHKIDVAGHYPLHMIVTAPSFPAPPADTFCGGARDANVTVYTIGVADVALAANCRVFKANLWLIGVAFKVLPCLLMMLLSIDLVSRLRKAERKRKALLNRNRRQPRPYSLASGLHPSVAALKAKSSSASGSSTKAANDRTTVMLIAILLIFLATELPQGAAAILSAIYPYDVHVVVYSKAGDLLDLLSLVNSCINFILMCTMSSRYRHTFCVVVLPAGVYRCLFPPDRNSAGERTMVGRASAAVLNSASSSLRNTSNPSDQATTGDGSARRSRPPLRRNFPSGDQTTLKAVVSATTHSTSLLTDVGSTMTLKASPANSTCALEQDDARLCSVSTSVPADIVGQCGDGGLANGADYITMQSLNPPADTRCVRMVRSGDIRRRATSGSLNTLPDLAPTRTRRLFHKRRNTARSLMRRRSVVGASAVVLQMTYGVSAVSLNWPQVVAPGAESEPLNVRTTVPYSHEQKRFYGSVVSVRAADAKASV